ncbi:MAG: ribosomal protein S18-alanine N-acetyltransferase [Frankiaceae bacterium]
MTGGARIEPMRWWHVGPVARLELAVFGSDAWSEELFWSELAQGALRHYLVAVDDDAWDVPAGYAGLAAYAEESYIQTLAVAPAARGGGLGTRLLASLLSVARARGARTCVLEVRTDNVAAQSIYRRFGFRGAGIRRGYYQPSGADALVMVADRIGVTGYGKLLDRVLDATAQSR